MPIGIIATTQFEERLDAIDEANNVIGCVTKKMAYELCISHRIVHVLVVRGDEVLVARRALSVRYLPGRYCTSAGGHVTSSEDVRSAALRELREEIGLDGPLNLLNEFFFTHEFKVHVSLFVKDYVTGVDCIQADPQEVMSTEFMKIEEALKLPDSECHPQLRCCLELLQRSMRGGQS